MEWDFVSPNPGWKLKVYSRPIESVQAVRVGRRIYPTPYMAAKAEAWHMICSRYVKADQKSLLEVRELRGMKCKCYGRDPGYCPLHSHRDGYFARLHKRLRRQLEAKYKQDLA